MSARAPELHAWASLSEHRVPSIEQQHIPYTMHRDG